MNNKMIFTLSEQEEKELKAKALIGDPHSLAIIAVRDIATGLDVDPNELISRATNYLNYGDYWVDAEDGGKFEGVSLPKVFWDHYEVLMEKQVPTDERGSFFSCSC